MSEKIQNQNHLEPTFSTLILSIASSAAMSLGIAPNPASNKIEQDLPMAKFNIDLLVLLKDKTKNNLSKDESEFLQKITSDLQMKFVQTKK